DPESDAHRLDAEEQRNPERSAQHDEAEISLQSFPLQLRKKLGQGLPEADVLRALHRAAVSHPAEIWPADGAAAPHADTGDRNQIRGQLQSRARSLQIGPAPGARWPVARYSQRQFRYWQA